MDIPSIKFRYFEKLKLWHDYLSQNSIFESQKKKYWDHEKVFLLWAFTPLHGHLYTNISTARILQIYNETGSDEFGKLKSYVDNDFAKKLDELKIDIDKNNGKINYVKGNLDVEGFVKTTEVNPKGYPEKVRILPKGLLLGEILFESYSKEASFWNKNFRKYKWGLRLLVGFITLSVFIVFSNQVIDLKKKIFNDVPKKNGIYQNFNNFEKHYYKFRQR